MPLPGTTVTIVDSAPPRTIPTDTGIWYVAGLTDKGKLQATLVQSISDFTTKFGGRVSYSILYDALDTFFREGGALAYVGRVVGPAALASTVTLNDGSAVPTLTVKANSPGAWGNSLNVQVTAGDAGGEFKLVITDDVLGTLETSPSLLDKTAALAWALSSQFITLTDLASSLDPAVVAAQSLTGGTDDRTNVTDTHWKNALALFTKDLGPGQVSMPGRTTDQAHIDTLAHAAPNRRIALLDAPDTPTVATLTASAGAARSDGRWGGMFAPWVVVPGIVGGTLRTVPPSALLAGLIARNDASGNANIAPAGRAGLAQYALNVSQNGWSDADRETLNDTGVSVIRVVEGLVRNYGFRSLANPAIDPAYTQLTNSRTIMAIAAEADLIAESYVFSQLDGRGVTISAFGGELSGMCLEFFNVGALFGVTSDAAFNVNVGTDVNTNATVAAGELHAVITLRVSPFGEVVQIEIVKRAATETV